MFGMIRPHVQPIGLDIGHDSVKMLQLEVAGGSLATPRRDALIVRAAQKRVLDDSARANPELLPRQAAEAIDDMFAGGDFVGRKCHRVPSPANCPNQKSPPPANAAGGVGESRSIRGEKCVRIFRTGCAD
jgi:hypothetical protein